MASPPIPPLAPLPASQVWRSPTRPDRPQVRETETSQVKRVFYAGRASSTISGGPGTDLVYLPGSPSDWVADGQGSYVNRLNPTLRVLLQDVEVVRFYSAEPHAAPRSILDAQA